jgi:hypothetical protein
MEPNNPLKVMVKFTSDYIKEPDTYTDSYVAFIDILGFKEIVYKKSFDEVRDILGNIRLIQELITKSNLYSGLIRQELISSVKITLISDSVIISIPKNSDGAFHCMIIVCATIIQKLFSLKEPLFCRGSICLGNIYQHDNSVFGPSLIEAYLMERDIAKYPRVIISPDCFIKGCASITNDKEKAFVKCFTKQCEEYWFVDFIKYILISSGDKFSDKALKLSKKISDILSTTDDNGLRTKYLWLKKYYNETISLFEDIYDRKIIHSYLLR